MTDLTTPEDISQHKLIKIGGARFLRTPHKYLGKSGCPICGGLGMPWHGWFSCEDCSAIAVFKTGATYIPVERHINETNKVVLL